jgi:hypothetical protein
LASHHHGIHGTLRVITPGIFGKGKKSIELETEVSWTKHIFVVKNKMLLADVATSRFENSPQNGFFLFRN